MILVDTNLTFDAGDFPGFAITLLDPASLTYTLDDQRS